MASDEDAQRGVAEVISREVVERLGADAVVILWTDRRLRATRVFRHQFGNGLLCNALVIHTATEQTEMEQEE